MRPTITVHLILSCALLLCIVHVQVVHCGCRDSEGLSSEQNYDRVQIKVYRGPLEQDGPKQYAAWGYWVKQPAN